MLCAPLTPASIKGRNDRPVLGSAATSGALQNRFCKWHSAWKRFERLSNAATIWSRSALIIAREDMQR